MKFLAKHFTGGGFGLMNKFYNIGRQHTNCSTCFNFYVVQPHGAAVNNFVIQLALSMVGQLFNLLYSLVVFAPPPF